MMIARANLVYRSLMYPSVLVTMLLAGPACAGTPSPTADRTRDSAAPPHSRTAATSIARPALTLTASAARRRARPRAAALHEAASPRRIAAFADDTAAIAPGSATGLGGWRQIGIASWYGGSHWQGQRTSSGASFDENQLTAAHATLPLGAKIRVSLLNSVKSVIVTITDRPGSRTRVIDLSRGAASALGILSRGLAMVSLSPI